MYQTFQWQDPLLLSNQLTAEERLLQDSVHRFAQDTLKQRVTEAFLKERFDRSLVIEFGELGLLGAALPLADSKNAPYVSYGLIARELERVDSGYRSTFSVQASLCVFAIDRFGTESQKERYLSRLLSGELLGCFGLTEPDHGSDPGGLKTKAIRAKDGWVLSGSKSWITHAPEADIFIVWAKCDDGKLRGFLLEKAMAGLSAPVIKNKLSLRASLTGMIQMDDVVVSNAQVLDVEGYKGPFECLNRARYGIAWGALGAAEDCWHTARQYVLDRKQFGAPLAAKQLVQLKLADMQTEITIGLHAALRLGRLMEEGTVMPEAISMLKRNSCQKALRIARMARDMLGANGISSEYSVMRHLMNLETVNTYEGTADIHGLILGKSQTGLAAF